MMAAREQQAQAAKWSLAAAASYPLELPQARPPNSTLSFFSLLLIESLIGILCLFQRAIDFIYSSAIRSSAQLQFA